MRSFDEIVNRQIRLVIPYNHFAGVRSSTIPGLDGFTFRTSLENDRYDLIHVLTLNAAFVLSPVLEERLIAMRDRLESRKELLLVLDEAEAFLAGGDLHEFISESFRIESPYFCALSCYRDRGFQTTIDGENFEDLHRLIRDIWTGRLRFDGPTRGVQQVNIELMKDACWKCQVQMRTLTGLVFPDRQLASWDNDRWLYYNHLVALQGLPDTHALIIQAFAETLRKSDPQVTPISYRYSHTTESSYWAAGCPRCGALRGDFHVQEARMDHLFDLTSRQRGDLQYYPLTLDVDRPLMELLEAGFEGCPHTRIMGWERSTDS